MSMRLALIFAVSLTPASAFAQDQTVAPENSEASQTSLPETKAFLESCTARKFETTVEVTSAEAKKRSSKVTLCGKEGQTDSDWIGTLKDAAAKVEANEKMAPAVKEQIITALAAEIARIETARPAAPAPAIAAVLPPESRSDYSILPPLPEPPKVAATAITATPAAAQKKPRVTIRCLGPGEKGAGSACASLERETRLTIRADEDLAGGASLRFLRRGDARGEVALTPMRQGQSIRSRLPSQLCSGISSSKVEIQVMDGSAKQVVETLGPYPLRC